MAVPDLLPACLAERKLLHLSICRSMPERALSGPMGPVPPACSAGTSLFPGDSGL